jgi:hypothetical protein
MRRRLQLAMRAMPCRATFRADRDRVNSAWDDVLEYLRLLQERDVLRATDHLDEAIDRDGIGAISDALADVCRSLMDQIHFAPGTIDVHTVVDDIAMRIVATSRDTRRNALDRQRSLIVFLGSEGLPCMARDDVASWSADDRLHDLIACTIGLMAMVGDKVLVLDPPGPLRPAEGTFTLAWRGPNGPEPFAGAMPRGYTAHITFVGTASCSLRSVFGRVATLRQVDTIARAAGPRFNARPSAPRRSS